MTAKEKAQELIDKYLDYVHLNWAESNAKNCALIAVEDVRDELKKL